MVSSAVAAGDSHTEATRITYRTTKDSNLFFTGFPLHPL
jgi:hypothetical protein